MGIQQLIILAQAEEEGRTGLDLVLPDMAELIGGALAFIVVFVVLSRIAFPKIRAAVEKRESEVQGNLERAENAKGEAEKVLEDYKRQLAEARSEANRIIEEARGQAEQVRKDLVAKAEKDAETIVTRAQEQIQAEQTRAVQELQGQIAAFSIELAEKVVGRSLDGETHRDLVDAYIKEVSGMRSNGGSSN
jgi:F-type H+-transporting ATPase subunit b